VLFIYVNKTFDFRAEFVLHIYFELSVELSEIQSLYQETRNNSSVFKRRDAQQKLNWI